MPRFGPVSRRRLVDGFSHLGFSGPYQGSRQEFMIRGQVRLVLPNPHRGDIGRDLLSRILREAGVSREEWESA